VLWQIFLTKSPHGAVKGLGKDKPEADADGDDAEPSDSEDENDNENANGTRKSKASKKGKKKGAKASKQGAVDDEAEEGEEEDDNGEGNQEEDADDEDGEDDETPANENLFKKKGKKGASDRKKYLTPLEVRDRIRKLFQLVAELRLAPCASFSLSRSVLCSRSCLAPYIRSLVLWQRALPPQLISSSLR
jgi:hypothetical protein